MKSKYWTRMTQMKFEIQYLKCHHARNVSINRLISIIQACISTGALAGLFAGQKYSFISSIILVISQFFTAAKPYLPYEYRINELEKGLYYFEELFNEVERDWSKINSSTENDEAEIEKMLEKYKEKWLRMNGSILKKDALPVKRAFIEKANKEKNSYFERFYGENENE